MKKLAVVFGATLALATLALSGTASAGERYSYHPHAFVGAPYRSHFGPAYVHPRLPVVGWRPGHLVRGGYGWHRW